MSLPPWDHTGRLPSGVHRVDLSAIYDRFVLDAPNRDERELLFSSLHIYLRLVRRFDPAGRAWIDGGFGTQKAAKPHDVDVVIHPGDWSALEALPESQQNELLGPLTHQDVIVGSLGPLYVERLQPIGGALDGFLCVPGHEATWLDTWASVKDDDGSIIQGAAKGSVEVEW